MNYWLFILIPVMGAFTGWIIIRLATWALFHPRNQKRIAGIRLQGVIPRRQQQLAVKIGMLASQAFSLDDLEDKISDPRNLEKILPMIENHIDDFLRNRLSKEMPVISMFVGDKTISKLKEAFMKEIELLFPRVMKEYASGLKKELDVTQLVTGKIAGFSVDTLEETVHREMSAELRAAGLAGAAIGFVIGLLQVLIILLVA